MVAFVVLWGFEDEGGVAKLGVVEDSGEGCLADFALTDVGVAVEVRAELTLGIVGVDHGDVAEAEDGFDGFGGGFESVFGGDVVAGG